MLVAGGSKLSGRQSWRLLWESSRPLSVAVLAWAAADALDGPLVVAALGVVVGAIPDAVAHGMSSPAGHRLIGALIIAALLYAASLVLDPIGGALGTAAHQRITGRLQARLLRAVTAPATIAHLEDQDTLNRLASRRRVADRLLPRRRARDLGRQRGRAAVRRHRLRGDRRVLLVARACCCW